MNGLKLYDQLHAAPGLEAIPALLLTATRLEALRPEIEQRQLTILEKPFDLDVFFLTVQRMLQQCTERLIPVRKWKYASIFSRFTATDSACGRSRKTTNRDCEDI